MAATQDHKNINQSSNSPTKTPNRNKQAKSSPTPKKKPTPRRLRPLNVVVQSPKSKSKSKSKSKFKSKIFIRNNLKLVEQRAKANRSIASKSSSSASLTNSLIEVPHDDAPDLDKNQSDQQNKVPTSRTLNQTDDLYSEEESDCEIIENVTPLIVLDDDCTTEPQSPASESVASNIVTNSVNLSGHSNAQSSKTDESVEQEQVEPNLGIQSQPEPVTEPLFYIDKNPCTTFEAPIYQVNERVNPKKIGEMSSPIQNIRINGPVNFTNKENEASNVTMFTPDPMLSSTRVDNLFDSLDESAKSSSSNDSSESDNNIHISINSTCETGESRMVTASRNSPKAPEYVLTGIHNNNNIEKSRPNKRKSEKKTEDEPLSKKNTPDVIVLNDTISDTEEDSVVFVSETIERRNRAAILGNTNRHNKALNYISLGNGSGNQKKSQSTRAKRRMEKKKSDKGKPKAKFDGKSKKQHQQPPSLGVRNRSVNRFDTRNPSTSFETFSTLDSNVPSTNTSESRKAVKRNQTIQYEKEKQLFAEHPELFEKRMIIIDGSNVARTHGVRDNSYSINGIEICIKHFEDRGFKVKAVVPQMRLKRSQSSDPDKLERMVNAGKIIVTPCKNLPGIHRSSSYDDRMILEAAEQFEAAIISNDNYADLLSEKPEWAEIIKERVVGFSFCDDFIMIPQDPYGKNGRPLQLILHKLKSDAKIDEKYFTK